MKITVTTDHVRTAKRRDSHHCMIADAVRDKTKTNFVLVDLQSIRFSNLKTGKRYFYLTPPIAQKAIIAFDRGQRVEPFSFTLARPVRVRNVRRQWVGDPKVLKKARATYERKTRATRSTKRGLASRERQFGVRMLAA
jgi:hypothetical protein